MAQHHFQYESRRYDAKKAVPVPISGRKAMRIGCMKALWFACASSEVEAVVKSLMSQDLRFDACDR